jgi:hypothetical protein
MRWPRRFESHFLMTKRLACNPAEDGSCLPSEHLSPLDESACNPKPKSWRQTGRIPFNLGHNDLANDNSTAVTRFCPNAPLLSACTESCSDFKRLQLPCGRRLRRPDSFPCGPRSTRGLPVLVHVVCAGSKTTQDRLLARDYRVSAVVPSSIRKESAF